MQILLVDDDNLSREMISEILRDLSDHEIVECQNAIEAFDNFMANPCPIVITDIHMPGHSGLELLRGIKNSQYGDDTDVIVITGLASMDNAIEALREGATDFLRKPIDFSQLLEIIDGIVAKKNNITSKNSLDKFASSSKKRTEWLDNVDNSDSPNIEMDSTQILPNTGGVLNPQNGFNLNKLILEIVSKTLDRFDGNQSKTAEFLSLSRGKLRTYIERLK